MPVSLTEFLLARIAEDEHVAMVTRADEHPNVRERSAATSAYDAAGYTYVRTTSGRLSRDCTARRRIVSAHQAAQEAGDETTVVALETVMRHLAAVHADHPDFDPAWRD